MITLKARLMRGGVDQLAVQQLGRRGFNDLLREALLATAIFWVKNYLPLHFQEGAEKRYQYLARSPRYVAKKRRFAEQGVRPIRVGHAIRLIRDGGFIPRPLHYTGAMAERVLQTPHKPTATVTSNRQQVRIPISLGHAVSRQTAHEVTKLLQSELADMHRQAHLDVVRRLEEAGIV